MGRRRFFTPADDAAILAALDRDDAGEALHAVGARMGRGRSSVLERVRQLERQKWVGLMNQFLTLRTAANEGRPIGK